MSYRDGYSDNNTYNSNSWEPSQGYTSEDIKFRNQRSQITRGHRQDLVEPGTVEWYQEKCRAALKDSVRTAAETNEISQKTAEQLSCQSDQLHRIRDDVDVVSHNLETSQYLIKGMKSWWGSVVQLFTTPPSIPSANKSISSLNKPSSADIGFPTSRLSNTNESAVSNRKKPSPFETEFDTEVDQGLDQLSTMLSEMHSRAIEIGSALETHNVVLDDIQVHVERNSDRMQKQKKDLDLLLKR